MSSVASIRLLRSFRKPGRYDYKMAEKEVEAYQADPTNFDHIEKARNYLRCAIKGYPKDHRKTGLAYITIAHCGWMLAEQKGELGDGATLTSIIDTARQADASWPEEDRESPDYVMLCSNTGIYYRARYLLFKKEGDRHEALRYHTKAWNIARKQRSDDLDERRAINNEQKSAAIDLATTRRMFCEVHCDTPEELDDVIRDLERALEKGYTNDSAHPVGLHELGIALELRNKLFPPRRDSQWSAFRSAIDLFEGRPHDQAVALDQFASELELQGDFDKAIICLDGAIRLVDTYPSASPLRYHRANLLLDQYSNKYASVKELDFTSRTTLSPTELGRTVDTTKTLRKAISDYEEALKDLPPDQKLRALFIVSAIYLELYTMPEAKELGDHDLEMANEKGHVALDMWQTGGYPEVLILEGKRRSLKKKTLEELLERIRKITDPTSSVSPATPTAAHTPVSPTTTFMNEITLEVPPLLPVGPSPSSLSPVGSGIPTLLEIEKDHDHSIDLRKKRDHVQASCENNAASGSSFAHEAVRYSPEPLTVGIRAPLVAAEKGVRSL